MAYPDRVRRTPAAGTKELAALIRFWREEMGLTIDQLAQQVGKSHSFVWQIEQERLVISNDETADKFSEVLGVDQDQIYAAGQVVPPDIMRMLTELPAEGLKDVRGFTQYKLMEGGKSPNPQAF